MRPPADGIRESLVDRGCDVSLSGPALKSHRTGIQFPLATLFVVTGLLSVLFGFVRLFGLTGALVFGDFIVLAIGMASLFRVRTMFGIRFLQVTIAEFGVLVILCFVFHGLAMLAVQSNCQGLGTSAAPAPVKRAAVGNSSSVGEGSSEDGD